MSSQNLNTSLQYKAQLALRNTRRLRKLVDVSYSKRLALRTSSLTSLQSILDMSKVEAGRLLGHFRPVQLGQVVSDLAALFRSIAEKKGIVFEILDFEKDPPPVYIDLGELVLVRVRLAINRSDDTQICGRKLRVICRSCGTKRKELQTEIHCRLSNAFKYTTKGKVTLSVTYDEKFAYMHVNDTGLCVCLVHFTID